MASTLEKIKTLLSKSKETKMYAEMILDDGRVLATEDEQFMIGSEVYVVGDDGSTEKLSAGSYTMSDGAKITVDENSKILDLGEEKEAEGIEKPKEEMAEEDEKKEEEIDEEKLAKAIDEATPDSVDKKKAKDMAKRVKEYAEEEEKKEDKEEEKTEASKEDVVEMSRDLITSLVEEVEHLKSKVVELEKVPGSKGFTHNPEYNTSSEKPNLANMTAQERAAFYINNK